MPNLITEDNIEQAILTKLKVDPFNYEIIICDIDPNKREDLNDGTGRTDKKQCILPKVIKESLYRINPSIEKDKLDSFAYELSKDFSGSDITETNYKNYKLVRDGKKIEVRRNGRDDFDFIKLIDYNNPENNTFTAVSQMWVKGHYYWRRPDVIIFVNGLPLVFIELKNSIVKVQEAYDDNLTNYKKDIPNLFAFNQICVLSNGLETKLGSITAKYEHFFDWLKNTEEEKVDRKVIQESGTSIEYFINGLLQKEKLLDYIENFILFDNQKIKIIAKNHQYLGVNNLMRNMEYRESLNGKLGVFWHTQGAGKSYSMIMFARKVRRKLTGNFTFLIITDRDDLDDQIHKNFVRTEVINKNDETQPKDSNQLRDWLGTNKSFIFTLIHKFRYDKTKKYPILSTRNDIIVLVDEAHRTQYKDLAENMRAGLPNANYIAFTGTPLLGSKRLTNQWFGDYVSEYNFAQSVDDGSTVPLFYSRRVPEVGLQNNFLDDDVLDIIEDEDLNEDEQRKLENSGSRILEVLKRDERLETVAKDIAHHFPRRGFLGKAMVVSVDKFTAVKMYDKVQKYWALEIQELVKERNNATPDKKAEYDSIIKYMQETKMAVVISDGNDDDKFAAQGLDISKHRAEMNRIDVNGNDIEDRFKDPDNPFRLVFVCAMWLTGFDVPSLSTLYLDKPMKSHTLMQAIARANRVYPNKPAGIIVDYVNVFKYMREALRDYGEGDDGEYPAKDIDQLITLLDGSISETNDYLKSIDVSLDDINNESDTFQRLELLRNGYDQIVTTDDRKDRFTVLSNTVKNLYEASKPEIFEKHWHNQYYAPIDYLYGLFHRTIDDQKVEKAREKLAAVLDYSVSSEQLNDPDKPVFAIHEGKVIDLSKLDIDQLKQEIKRAPYKAIEIDDLKEYIKEALEMLINRNCERLPFSERFKNIIDRYNAGGTENEEYYEQLLQLISDLKQEASRASLEGLTEEELEIYDLLIKGKKLTKAEEQKVKLAAKNLYKKLSEEKEQLMIVDWYKDDQPVALVKDAIQKSLDHDLPECYDKESFASKISLLLNHFMDMSIQGYGWVGA